MTPTIIAGNSAIAFLVMGAIGVLFGWVIFRVGRWRGGWAMTAGWAAAAVIFTALMTFRIHLAEAKLGFTPEQQARMPIFSMFLPMWAAALGGVTVVVWRSIARGVDRFTPALAARSFGAWLLGAFLFFMVFAVLDVTSMLPFGK